MLWQGEEPTAQIWPTEAFPPGTPLTLQATEMFAEPVTCTKSVSR